MVPILQATHSAIGRLMGHKLAGRHQSHGRCRAVVVGPIEALDRRIVPSTFRVTNLLDSGPGTLRTAIEKADRSHNASVIKFARSLSGTITLTSALPALTRHISICGPGSPALTVARSSAQGTADFGVFTVSRGAVVSMTGLNIANGSAAEGAGIENAGTLTLANVELTDNAANLCCGYGGTADGGGIENSGKLSITGSTFSDNSAAGLSGHYGIDGAGGAIANSGTLTVTACVFSGNSAIGGQGNFRRGQWLWRRRLKTRAPSR